jgi:hypothetical protein
MAELREVFVDNALDVAVQLRAPQLRREVAQTREARLEHLLRVIGEPERADAGDLRPLAGEQFAQADGRAAWPAFCERERSHPQRDDAPSARVNARALRRNRARQQKRPRRVMLIDRATDAVPDGRMVLPLVDEHRGRLRQCEAHIR